MTQNRGEREGWEQDNRCNVTWPPEHVADTRLNKLVKRATSSGDILRANAYSAEIARRTRLRNATSAIRAEAMDFLKILYVIHERHAEGLPAELLEDIRGRLVKHGIIVPPE